ncbi:hypothetical protein [Nonomuraea rosea]
MWLVSDFEVALLDHEGEIIATAPAPRGLGPEVRDGYHAEADQFAVDPPIPPPRVLACQA